MRTLRFDCLQKASGTQRSLDRVHSCPIYDTTFRGFSGCGLNPGEKSGNPSSTASDIKGRTEKDTMPQCPQVSAKTSFNRWAIFRVTENVGKSPVHPLDHHVLCQKGSVGISPICP